MSYSTNTAESMKPILKETYSDKEEKSMPFKGIRSIIKGQKTKDKKKKKSKY